jgi:hypothetical protein
VGVCREVSPTTKISVGIQMKSSHLPWAKKEQTTKEIDLENLFNTYWTSKAHEITVAGQSWSPTSLLISDGEAQRLVSLDRVVFL